MEQNSPPLKRRIEEVSLNAWPCLQQILYDGWILRFARGYTKRANSVNGLWPLTLDVEAKIAFCEACYRARALPTIFRITPFAQPGELDGVLAERGYARLDPTIVMCLDLFPGERYLCSPVAATKLRHEDLDSWLALFDGVHGGRVAGEREAHRDILRAIPGERLLASLAVGGDQAEAGQSRRVACGLAVLEETYLGLYDLIVDAQYRSQGYGTALVEGLLSWGQENGARHAYLQVTVANVAARRLYEKLGFQELYHYWYRISTG